MRPLTLLSLLPLLPSSTARPVCSEAGSPCLNGSRPLAPLLERCRCGRHAFCFFGVCMCHPGYDPSSQCTRKLGRLNPWMSKGCLALHSNVTFAIDMPLPSIGGEYHRDGSLCPKFMRQCAYLCFSHLSYGVAVVPRSLWQQAQYAEAQVWAESGRSVMVDASSNDRAEEHWAAFSYLSCLPPGTSLGSVVEVGAGPWTQLKPMLHYRTDLQVGDFTVVEPSARNYMAEVSSCSYRSGNRLEKFSGDGFHAFPVKVLAVGGELIPSNHQFDTLISINVLEHVQNAFEYLTQLRQILRPGGLLIFHERYYYNAHIMDGDLLHPIRIKRRVLDIFLNSFEILFNNCSAAYGMRPGETGYYVIARRRSS